MAISPYPSLKPRFFCDSPWRSTPSCVLWLHIHLLSNTLTVFLTLSVIHSGFFVFYRPGLQDWGPVHGTRTGIFCLSFYYYYQNSKAKILAKFGFKSQSGVSFERQLQSSFQGKAIPQPLPLDSEQIGKFTQEQGSFGSSSL